MGSSGGQCIVSIVPTCPGDDASVTDLVTRLREDELQNLRAQLNGGSREVALKNLGERGIAQELIRQQYSGRYPFELLQSADDAAAERTDGGWRRRAVRRYRLRLDPSVSPASAPGSQGI